MTDMPSVALKLLLLDIDGVMTDGRKTYDSDAATLSKAYCDLDFTAIKCFMACGVNVMLISGDGKLNRAMAQSRGIDFILSRKNDVMVCKSKFLPEILQKYGCTSQETGFCGDDIFDIEVLGNVGWSFCPANSPKPVQLAARHALTGRSGEYLVMEIFEFFVALGLLAFPSAEDVMAVERNKEKVRYS